MRALLFLLPLHQEEYQRLLGQTYPKRLVRCSRYHRCDAQIMTGAEDQHT